MRKIWKTVAFWFSAKTGRGKRSEYDRNSSNGNVLTNLPEIDRKFRLKLVNSAYYARAQGIPPEDFKKTAHGEIENEIANADASYGDQIARANDGVTNLDFTHSDLDKNYESHVNAHLSDSTNKFHGKLVKLEAYKIDLKAKINEATLELNLINAERL